MVKKKYQISELRESDNDYQTRRRINENFKQLFSMIGERIDNEINASIDNEEIRKYIERVADDFLEKKTVQINNNSYDISSLKDSIRELISSYDSSLGLISNNSYDISSLKDSVSNLDKSISTNASDISSVKTDVASKQDKITINDLSNLSTSNQAALIDTKTFPNGQAEFSVGISKGGFQTVVNPSISTHGNAGGNRDTCAFISIINTYLAHNADIYYANKYVPLRFESTKDNPNSTFTNPIIINPRDHRNDNGQMACDCVTLTNLVANGITYGNSSYASNDNDFEPAHPFFDIYDDAVKAYFFASQEDEDGVVRENFPAGSIGRGRLAASSTARYLYDRGLLEFVDTDKNSGLNNLVPGDILFHAKNYPDNSGNIFMGITHTTIFCGGLNIQDIDTLIVCESARFDGTGVGVRKLSRTIKSGVNGPVVAKFSPNYTIGPRLMLYDTYLNNAAYRCSTRKFDNYDFSSPYIWECGTLDRYGARVVSLAIKYGYTATLDITLTNKIPALEGGAWSDISGSVNLTGCRTFIIPYGFDIKIETTSTRQIDIIQQICLSDKQIVTPIQSQ